MPLAADTVSEALSGLAGALRVPVHVAALALLALLTLELGRLTIEGWRRGRPGTPRLQEVAAGAPARSAAPPPPRPRPPGPPAERTLLDQPEVSALERAMEERRPSNG